MTNIEAQNNVNAGEDFNSFGAGMDFFGDFGGFFDAPEPPRQTPTPPTVEIASEPIPAASQPQTEAIPIIENAAPATEEKKEELVQGTLNAVEKIPEPPVEEKPKKRRTTTTRRTRKTKEVAIEEENTAEEETPNISIENTVSKEAPESTEVVYIPVDPTLDVRTIISSLNLIPDTTFMETQKMIQEKMNAIKIEKNIDKANITLMYDYIDELSDILRSNYAVVKTIYDNLVNKEVGIIANVKKLNMVGPGTVADKERNAIKSLIAYKTDTMDEPVNLIQASWAANYEFNFLESAIEQLETKRRILRGMEEAIL